MIRAQPPRPSVRWLVAGLLVSLAAAPLPASTRAATGARPRPGAGAPARPVYVGLDLEFTHRTSTSAEAIRRGVLIAIDEINRRGGVLGGRPLAVIERDNHSIAARAVENVRELARMEDLVAVFCGKFGPAALEALPVLHQLRLPLLDPWASPDSIVENGYRPNYVFRLSLTDTWAMRAMLGHAAARGLRSVGLMLPNTAWGRSNESAATAYLATRPAVQVVGTSHFNFGDTTLVAKYQELRRAGAQAILLVAIESEAAVLVRELAALPERDRLPIISHHGTAGGDLAQMTGPALQQVDLTILQAYSFVGARRPAARRVLDEAERLFGVRDVRDLVSPAGVATAYDLTHILALAVDRAGSTDRAAVRDELERVPAYDGLVKRYAPPFTPTRHEALAPSDLVFARFDERGVLTPVRGSRR